MKPMDKEDANVSNSDDNQVKVGLANAGEVSKPVTLLFEKISEVIGSNTAPWQLQRIARTQADAQIIKAGGETIPAGLEQRAFVRLRTEQVTQQSNIERITQMAIPDVKSDATPDKIDNDWVSHFIEKCKRVSDAEVQKNWSKILAGEANSPGSYSKRTIDILSTLDKKDAEMLAMVCSFSVEILGVRRPLIFDVSGLSVYGTYIFSQLSHLKNIGLVGFEHPAYYALQNLAGGIYLAYFGNPICVEFKPGEKGLFKLGHAIFTESGRQLANLCESRPVEGFQRYVEDCLVKEYPRVTGGRLAAGRQDDFLTMEYLVTIAPNSDSAPVWLA